jgi:hypothetical protein
VLWIRIGFDADPDLGGKTNAVPDPGSQTNADPDPGNGQTLPSQKVRVLHEKYRVICNRSKNILYLRRYKSHLEKQETRFVVIFCKFPSSWTRIRDSQISAELRIRIRIQKAVQVPPKYHIFGHVFYTPAKPI